MSTAKSAPYGTWSSPITAELIATQAISFDDVLVDSLTGAVYHVEKRPSEGGRLVIVDSKTGQDAIGKDWNARTGVHEYGGTCAAVRGGVIYFSNFSDGRVYKVEKGKDPVAVTPASDVHRFADFTIYSQHPELLVSILEDHTKPAPADVVNTLVVINTSTSTVTPFVSGADFYSSPVFNPSGNKVAWVQWNHPDMPWEGGEVFVANVEASGDGKTISQHSANKIAGEYLKISAVQPHWADDITLLFTSDYSGFQNPWIVRLGPNDKGDPTPVLKEYLPQDFGEPAWQLGDSCYAILDENTAVFAAFLDGRSRLYTVDLTRHSLKELSGPYVHVSHVRRVSSTQITFLGDKSDEAGAVILATLDLATGSAEYAVLKSGSGSDDDAKKLAKYFAAPEPLTLKVSGDAPLYVVLYPPTSPDYVGPASEKPPCVIYVHGGPTSMTTQALSLRQQYFTSRGWAWVDVNYGGSSGYGRKYIGRLAGLWGITDVNDSIQAVLQLSAPPLSRIDPKRVVLTGGSAGGFTTLASLCAASEVFAAGTSSYGVSELRKLAEDTHKFESHYLEKLVGGTPEEIPKVYEERSPLYNAAKIRSPLLVLQGSEDKVVPPQQAEEMVKVIEDKGGIVKYKLYPGEGHGWRKAETIIDALKQEIHFYNEYLKIGA